MNIDEKTMQAAYRVYAERYGRLRNWRLADHVRLWCAARSAFRNGAPEDFHTVYTALRKGWQVFRGARSHWSEQQIFRKMRRLDASCSCLRLSVLRTEDMVRVRQVVAEMVPLKGDVNGRGSLVAVSKFLHFWNPGLFVIVDRSVMWEYVLRHAWLKRMLVQAAEEVGVPAVRGDEGYGRYVVEYYPAVLWMGSRLIKGNPSMMRWFEEVVLSQVPDAAERVPLAEYEAPAVEWLLIGLVELVPGGVRMV